ncbi:FAD-binding domain-containing protein [Neolentinus lepideus HHB14362 ss-1]|uniref:D-lactate dehydrogenase (cytochrome) n=1 Tax=Neolentinus lepideus HHB14362 ss-1 TaxID=1314782 RepID=A0A165MW50_9AGAM|nr:FAD-binding domain-containing protein [Neolentinus lepideus HHB14362 ss-1]
MLSTSRRIFSRTSSFVRTRCGPSIRVRYNSGSSQASGVSLGRATSALVLASVLSGYAGYSLASPKQANSHSTTSSDSLRDPKWGSPEDFQRAIKELEAVFAGSPDVTIETDPEVLHVHGYSESDYHPAHDPTVVVTPQTTDDVVKIVHVATKYRMPITAYSGGTSLEGQFRSSSVGGICVDMGGMNRILEIHEEDSDLVCQPGAGWMDINDILKEKGLKLFFPLDPAPSATIGGMMSNGCSGTNAVRYGTAKAEWFLNATVVLPSGEVIKTRRRARKSSAGFDTTKLFIGAEGTLGIVTEVTIRLAPLLPTNVAVVHFPDVRKATAAVREILNRGVGIQCVELVDNEFMRATNLMHLPKPPRYPELDSLFFKLQGPTPESLAETAKVVKAIVEKKEYGGTGWKLARNDEEAVDIWTDRRNAHYSGLQLLPGARGWATDVCVPISKLPDLVYETKKDIKDSGLVSHIVGHVGDGNFHALLLFRDDQELDIVRNVVHRMVERAIALDGTCTGEHGVGMGKKEYLYEELGEGTVELMKTIKRAIDPLNLFNPGKLYPDWRPTS